MADFHMHADPALKGTVLPVGHDGQMLVNGTRIDCEVCAAPVFADTVPPVTAKKPAKQPIQ